MSGSGAHRLHLSVAEHGKLCLLKGDIPEALRHFREALRLSVSARAPEVFFRHYTQCVLEALELGGHHADVAAFCRQADAHYGKIFAERGQTAPFDAALLRKDHGTTLERLGLALLQQGDAVAARETLTRAIAVAGAGALPLAEAILGWLRRGLTVSTERLRQMQAKHRYFTVRHGKVDPDLARALPPETASASFPSPPF
jgi:tetratricopeptide (TPR) repeat protein